MNQIRIGTFISYVALLLNILIGLLYTPWMINEIGKADYGLYTLAMSVISLFVFDFGLGNAVTRFISKYLAEGRQDKVDNLLGLVFKLYLLGDLIIITVLFLLYFFLPTIYQGLTPDEMQKFRIIYIIASLFSVISFPFLPLNGIFISYEKFIQLKSCDLLHKVIIVILMTSCLIMGGGLFSLVIVNSVAGIIIILLKLYLLGQKKMFYIQWHFWDKNLLRSVFSFSVFVIIIQLSQRCIFNIAPSILATFATSASITTLGIAICLEGYTFSFASAINGMFLPSVSRMVVTNNKNEILKLMIRIGRIQIYIIGLICVGFICVGREFISVWLGEGYEDVYACALLIILPSFLQLPQDIGNTTIIAEGKVKLQAFSFLIMAVLNLLLAIPMAKYWGVRGLCASIMVAYMVRTLMMDYIFYKKLSINVFKFFRESYIRILPSLIITTFSSMIINSCVSETGWLGFIIKSGICFVLYCFLVYFLAMNDYEKHLLLQITRNIIKK